MERLAARVLPWVYSLGTHLALLAMLSVSFSFGHADSMPPAAVAIKARVVDEALFEQEIERLDAQDSRRRDASQDDRQRLAREADRAREEEERRVASEEQQRRIALENERREQTARQQAAQQEAAVREAATQRAAKDEAQRAKIERQRKEESERLAKITREREEQEARLAKIANERKEQERRRQEEEIRLAAVAKQRTDEEKRRRAAAEAGERARLESELAVAIQAEERRRVAEDSGLLAHYKTLIQQKVERNWARPPSASADLDCEVRVRQIPGGEVVDVRIARCNGDAAVMRSIEAAVYKASPLPPPPDPTLFERDLLFEFRPD